MASSDIGKAGIAARGAPSLRVSSLDDPFRDNAISELASLLPEFIAARRWYRAKARSLRNVEIEDLIAVSGIDSWILVLRMSYTDGDSDCYLLPVAVAPPQRSGADEVIASLHAPDGSEAVLYSAFSSRAFRDALLSAIARNNKLAGRRSDLIALRTSALESFEDLNLESFVSGAEQSNTSVIYRDRYILKMFRKIEPGINPDIEIGGFLTGHGFQHTPAVLGSLEYRTKDGEAYAAGILQRFVPNQGDAWKYTLEALNEFFGRVFASAQAAPELPSYHPMHVAVEPAMEFKALLGGYIESAHRLGVRTAEMHATLADPKGGSEFAPEPFTQADGRKLHEELLGQKDIAFELLRRKLPGLAGAAAEEAHALLRAEHHVTDRFASLREQLITAARMRIHGDYHLGQVLYTGSDFMIIDFEGEPARPLSERRGKTLAMRDVAGMLRSFQYAAYSAVFEQAARLPANSEAQKAAERWSAFWTAQVSAAYLKGYFDTSEGAAFVSRSADEQRLVLDAFFLHKALYEVAYELNNRPNWVRIPLRGVLSLVS